MPPAAKWAWRLDRRGRGIPSGGVDSPRLLNLRVPAPGGADRRDCHRIVLFIALLLTWMRTANTRLFGLLGRGFAFLGTLVGVFTITIGVGPRTLPDVTYHAPHWQCCVGHGGHVPCLGARRGAWGSARFLEARQSSGAPSVRAESYGFRPRNAANRSIGRASGGGWTSGPKPGCRASGLRLRFIPASTWSTSTSSAGIR